jgi:transposase
MPVGLYTQEVPTMLPPRAAGRQRSSRHPFLPPLWEDDHPELLRIDASLPAGHHARWLAGVVGHLDLGPLRRSYANRGSLAYPPELLLAFVLFMYSKGLLSPADWAEQARYDDQAKWLLRGLRPSRSQLYTFRDRTEPSLDAWHRQLLAWAVAEGITSAARGSLDGTFVAALASRHRLLGPRRLDRRLLLLRLLVWLESGPDQPPLAARLAQLPELVLLVLLLWLALLGLGLAGRLQEPLLGLLALLELLSPEGVTPWPPRLPAWVPATPAGRRRVLQRYQQAQQRLARRLEPYQQKKKLSKKDQRTLKHLKVSLTDPEAALGRDKLGTYRPLYNVPLVQATDAALTLAWDLLPRATDEGLLVPMMEKTNEQLGRHLQDVLVDGAFLSVGDVAWCEQQGITVYAPPSQAAGALAQQGKAPAEPSKHHAGGKKPGKLPKGAFRYDEQQKVYYCPQGKPLPQVYQTREKRASGVELPVLVHRAAGEDCQACGQQSGCTSNPKKGRVLKRYQGEEALERLEQRMRQPASQEVYKHRSRSVELGFADLKEHRGLRVFHCFGRRRARAQVGLVILASNGLKLIGALQRRQQAVQPPPPPLKRPA